MPVTIPPQNFAVAPRNGGAEPAIAALRAAKGQAWWRWWDLYCDPAVWTDPEKRRAMHAARWAYHEAVFAWLEAGGES